MTPKHPPAPPMTLGNMREPGLENFCPFKPTSQAPSD
jgi:hypothetical protein